MMRQDEEKHSIFKNLYSINGSGLIKVPVKAKKLLMTNLSKILSKTLELAPRLNLSRESEIKRRSHVQSKSFSKHPMRDG